MISLVIKFVIPCKLRAPDAKTWVVVVEFFNKWALISRSHHTSQVLVSMVKTLNKLVGMHCLQVNSVSGFYLASEQLNCGACAIGAFDDELMAGLLGIDGLDEFVIYCATVGTK
jgi:hypothetical protein